MRLGVFGPWLEPWAQSKTTWRHLENIGFDVGYLGDHLTHPTLKRRWLADGFTTLAAVAQVTTSMELGTLVASATIRHPAPLARAATTLQDLSGGRFVLGVGAGVPADAAAVDGATTHARYGFARYIETVEALSAIWSGNSSWQGVHVSTTGLTALPSAPGQQTPHLLLSAHGVRGYNLVAKCGDGWTTYGGAASASLPDDDFWTLVGKQSRDLTKACEEIGRDAAGLRRSLLVGYGVMQPLKSVDAYLHTVDRAAAAGFNEVVVYWPWPDTQPGDRFWANTAVIEAAVAKAHP